MKRPPSFHKRRLQRLLLFLFSLAALFISFIPQFREHIPILSPGTSSFWIIIVSVLAGLLLLHHLLARLRLSGLLEDLARHLEGLDPLAGEIVLSPELAGGNRKVGRIVAAINRMVADVRGGHDRLRQSELLFRTVTEFALDWAYWLDPHGNLLYVSPACERITGYSPGEFRRDPGLLTSIVHQEDRSLLSGHPEKVLLTGVAHRPLEYRILTKEGKVRWLSHVCRGIYTEEGEFLGIRGSNTDISDRKTAAHEAREELARERELLSITLDSMGEGMIVVCREGSIVLFNKMAEVLTGWREEEAVGKPLEDIYQGLEEATGRLRTGTVEEFLAQAPSRTPSRSSILIGRNGDRRLIAESCSPIRDGEGGTMGVAIVFRDIGNQRRLEQEALKAEKLEALGILAGGIAHDFNNLLTAVLGNISLAKLHVDPRSRIVSHLAAAEKASLRTRDLTQQLLTFARGGAPIKEVTAFGDFIRNAATFALRGSDAELDLALQLDLRVVEIDQGQMGQVINSLMLNAVQAMAGSGTVAVRVENVEVGEDEGLPLAPGPYVKITVADSGKGIPTEHLPHIFDPYFTTSHQGSGLGLASSYSVIKRHGGHIGVESVLGEGSTFTIHLPASPRQYSTESAGAEPVRNGEGRVLVMDDEPMIREMAGELLGYLGYEVDFAAHGEEAVRRYEEALRAGHAYRLVIVDLTVPGGMGGREAVQWILDLDATARVVVSSGYTGDPVLADYERYGFSGALTKPYNLRELVRTINRLLDVPESHPTSS